MTNNAYKTLCIAYKLSEENLASVKKHFPTVHYHPDGKIPKEVLGEVNVWLTHGDGMPGGVERMDQIPKTKFVQISSAGAGKFLEAPIMKTEEGKKQITLCSASGVHVMSIPPWIIAQIINVYRNLHIEMYLTRKTAKWPSQSDIEKEQGYPPASAISLYGKTAGMLGYGHIGRETARILKAMNVNIIAANSNGTKREDDGYIIEGTGDKDGSIPSKYYATTDPASFEEFLSKSDIIVASLPSTGATKFLLTARHFEVMKKDAVFLNVGRGDLAHSEDILKALNRKEKPLAGVALDVTDPEPLTDSSPLYTHPRAIITPHTSGGFREYADRVVELLILQVGLLREGKKGLNVVDPEKGY